MIPELAALENAVIQAAIACYAENRGVFGTYDYRPGYLKIEGHQADAHDKLLETVGRLVKAQGSKIREYLPKQ